MGKENPERAWFEVHRWGDPRLPFIFHTDTAREKSSRDSGNFHDSLEFLLVLSGAGTVFTDRQFIPAVPGDLLVINSGTPHRIEGTPGITYHCLIVGTEFCLENGFSATAVHYTPRIRDDAMRAAYLAVVEALAWPADTPFRTTAVRAEVLHFLDGLNRRFVLRTDIDPQDMPAGVRAAIDYINQHFTERLSADDLAGVARMSKYHFLRGFKRVTGYTVVTYINLLRCKAAVRLLASGDAPVSRIAADCGFENLSYFSRVFERYIGTLPSRFRRESSKTSENDNNPLLSNVYLPPKDRED